MLNSEKRILALIPARAGSKRLPGKNSKMIAGKPLLGWTCEAAVGSKIFSKVMLSTDGEELAEIGRQFGVDVPFLRPKEISTDAASSADVVIHALDFCANELNEKFDAIVLLEPTSPLRKANDIDSALTKWLEVFEDYDSLISYGKVQLEQPRHCKAISGGKVLAAPEPLPAHLKKDVHFPYGVIYGCKVETFYKEKTFYTERVLPYEIERWQNYEVDDFCDFLVIERLLQARQEGIL